MKPRIPLESAAAAVCKESATPPLIFQMPVSQGRQTLEKIQNRPVWKPNVVVSTLQVDTGRWGCVHVHFLKSERCTGTPNVIYYIHGAGWAFGSLHTHDKLVRELACRTNSIVVFPEYSRSPEARYPVAVEQCYRVLCMQPGLLDQVGWSCCLEHLTVAGDSAGGNMATVMTLLAKARGGPCIGQQLLYYPVTNCDFNTPSYLAFANGYHLYRQGMMWFWNQYCPSPQRRLEITASPLRASLEQLRGLPPAMVITAEADVLRSEGEAYARKLRMAGVDVTSVRFSGMIHDFVMLNALDCTNAARLAMDVSTDWLNRCNGCSDAYNPCCAQDKE